VNETKDYEVEVGTGDEVRNQGICKHMEVEVKGIPIVQLFCHHGVRRDKFGVRMGWLASLGNVKANFKHLILTWGDKGAKKSMQGDPSLCKSQASWKTMVKALN